ncbi:MAG TPA: AN1-type zinc finger domain-containing protein [Candidatus Lokiarchaeia archaeon]
MPKCYHCGENVLDLFQCNECGQSYCSLHREPLNHECNIVKESYKLSQISTPTTSYIPVEAESSVVRGTTDGSYTWHRQERSIPENAFSPDSGIQFKGIFLPHKSEFLHLLIGAILIFTIGFIGFFNQNLITQGYLWSILMLAGFYTTAFLFHEFGHRQVALHFGLQTKFRLLTFGMTITILSLMLGIITLYYGSTPIPSIALPGAVVVLGLDKIDRKTGLCKAAGPSVNLVYGTILLIISFMVPIYPLNLFIGYSAALNFTLGLFNMIPIGILDGQNIWKWNKIVYLMLFLSLLALLIFAYMNIFSQTAYFPKEA